MATLSIGGATYPVRTFKLTDLEQTADLIDEIWAAARMPTDQRKPSDRFRVATKQIKVLAHGVDGVTAEQLIEQATGADIDGLWITFVDMQKEAGLIPQGEAEPADAPAAPQTPNDPLSNSSDPSSPS